jgi:hypothetical protein
MYTKEDGLARTQARIAEVARHARPAAQRARTRFSALELGVTHIGNPFLAARGGG